MPLYLSSKLVKAKKCSFHEYNKECGVPPAPGPDCDGFLIEIKPGLKDWQTAQDFNEYHKLLSESEIQELLTYED